MKSGRVIINSAQEFSVVANKFVSSTVTLFQKKKKDLLCEPDDINQSPSIPTTLQINKFLGSSTAEGGTKLIFISSQIEKKPAILSHIWKGNVVTWRGSVNL